ncbi:MAG TPA: secretin N-terminal domain-containing protein [Burkholderiales bacterium]|nr:secretin N-terminal domain-containing protein [Burkholderiales bacterium]
MSKLIRIAVVAAILAPAPAWPQSLEIVPLKHRTVDQVLPILRPLLEPGGTISGTQSTLIVRTSPRNLAELKQVLANIDKAPRRLLISVRQDASIARERREAEVSGTLGTGRVVIGSGSPANERGVTARITDTGSSSESGLVQQIQVLEGSPARIQTGQSVPVVNRTVTPGPRGTVASESVIYRDVATGFEVVPRVVGDRVMLDVSSQRETPGAAGSADVQRMASTVSGRLGEWIELGGIVQEESSRQSDLLYGSGALRQDNRRIWVKVEEIH